MRKSTRWLSGLGVVCAAVASIATNGPGDPRSIEKEVSATVTLTADAPVATLAFRVKSDGKAGGREHGFAIQRREATQRQTPDPSLDCLPFEASPRPDGGREVYAYTCVPKGAAMPDVLIQMRERTTPPVGFGLARPVDYAQTCAGLPNGCSGLRAPKCSSVSEDGSKILDGGGCAAEGLAASCADSDAHCEHVFEVRLVLRDKSAGPRTVNLIGTATASSTSYDEPLTASVGVVP